PVNVTETFAALVPEPALWPLVWVPYELVWPYSTSQVLAIPLGSMEPATCACVGPTDEAEPVLTPGAGCVVKTASVPTLVPSALVAVRRKWYVVPGVSPERVVATAWLEVPEPALCALAGALLPYPV